MKPSPSTSTAAPSASQATPSAAPHAAPRAAVPPPAPAPNNTPAPARKPSHPLIPKLRESLARATELMNHTLTFLESEKLCSNVIEAQSMIGSLNHVTGVLYRLVQIHKTLDFYEMRPIRPRGLEHMFYELQNIIVKFSSTFDRDPNDPNDPHNPENGASASTKSDSHPAANQNPTVPPNHESTSAASCASTPAPAPAQPTPAPKLAYIKSAATDSTKSAPEFHLMRRSPFAALRQAAPLPKLPDTSAPTPAPTGPVPDVNPVTHAISARARARVLAKMRRMGALPIIKRPRRVQPHGDTVLVYPNPADFAHHSEFFDSIQAARPLTSGNEVTAVFTAALQFIDDYLTNVSIRVANAIYRRPTQFLLDTLLPQLQPFFLKPPPSPS